MTQYIPKSALIAEIESLLDKGRYHEEYDCAYRDGNNGALYALKGKVNTLEVKEVDLDTEIIKWEESFGHYPASMGYKETAKHFFELGMKVSNKAQKGE